MCSDVLLTFNESGWFIWKRIQKFALAFAYFRIHAWIQKFQCPRRWDSIKGIKNETRIAGALLFPVTMYDVCHIFAYDRLQFSMEVKSLSHYFWTSCVSCFNHDMIKVQPSTLHMVSKFQDFVMAHISSWDTLHFNY